MSAGGGGKKPNKEEDNQIFSAAALLLLVLAARSLLEEDTSGNGREITWSDFYNHILEPGDVDRIVVINGKTARVFLKHGSPGVPLSRQSAASLPIKGSSERASSSSSVHPRRDKVDPFDDETVMDMGASTPLESVSSSSPMSGTRSVTTPSNRQLVYHFHIGSVESFEEKLTKSQQELGISPRDYVPVQYANETNWALELMKSAPALLMIGIMAYMMRGMGAMGGSSGGRSGGMGGIFQVGKSNAKKDQ
jgi:FtsH Extracellular.